MSLVSAHAGRTRALELEASELEEVRIGAVSYCTSFPVRLSSCFPVSR